MRWRRDGRRFLGALEPGEEVVASILRFADEGDLQGAVFHGIGAVNHARVGFFQPDRKAYDVRELRENLEVVALMGNFAHADGDPFVHAHIVLGRADLSLIGGHLFEATVSVTLELALDPTQGRMERFHDPRFDLKLLRFD